MMAAQMTATSTHFMSDKRTLSVRVCDFPNEEMADEQLMKNVMTKILKMEMADQAHDMLKMIMDASAVI